jgi:hypothetical protein
MLSGLRRGAGSQPRRGADVSGGADTTDLRTVASPLASVGRTASIIDRECHPVSKNYSDFLRDLSH